MRISDWSSDVCSSDLGKEVGIARGGIKVDVHRVVEQHIDAAEFGHCRRDHAIEIIGVADIDGERDGSPARFGDGVRGLGRVRDRRSGGWGKSGLVRVDLGGGRYIKKKRNKIMNGARLRRRA